MNKVILVGNLGRDPEVRSLPSGQPVAEFSIATNRRWTDREGAKQEETEWHNIVVFGRQAEIAAQYLTKGSKVCLEGRLRTRNWEDRETGKKMYKTEIVADFFEMLGGRGEGPGGGGGGGRQYEPAGGSGGGGGDYGQASPGGDDDDIPF